MYDVIVIGARCAGSSTAMLLARQGHKVLVLDKAHLPSDVLSTHFLWPRGTSYLNKWGLLDRLLATVPSGQELCMTVEDIELRGVVPVELLQQRFQKLHGGDASYVTSTYCSPRRRVLDELLANAAQESGAELRLGFTVEALLMEGDRVVGVQGRGADGQTVTEHAKVVVGADGRRSFVAQSLKVQKYDERQRCSFAYFSYYSGFNFGGAKLFKRGRFGLAVVPTHFNQNMTLVWGPHTWFEDFLQDAESNYLKTIDYVAPEVGAIIRGQGKREEKFYGTADQAAYCRKSHGPGWALAGDAACFKDQATAMGMTHAFRDAELLSTAIHQGLTGAVAMDQSLEDYQWRRNEDATNYLDFVGAQAEMNPVRPDELEVFMALRGNQAQTNRFFACYGDTLAVSEFFSISNLTKLKMQAPEDYSQHPQVVDMDRWTRAFTNPYRPIQKDPTLEDYALSRTSFDFARLSGTNMMTRTQSYHRWMTSREQTRTWPFGRAIHSAAGPTALIRQQGNNLKFEGVNFASQDYLALNAHPAIQEAVISAVKEFGPHSAGSPQLIGNTTPSLALEAKLAEMLQMEHVLLYPTGWAAGFGAIAGLVRPDDHIVLDKLAHACLQQGAYASTKKVTRHVHGHLDSVKERLRTIRRKDARNGVLVVTEGLFSMDSDTVDLERMQALCREYDATLLVDVAHDFGSMGPGGAGQLAVQNMLGKVDLVMGSFSKTFATNGGFLATRSASVKSYMKMFSGAHTFSNALSPVQAAVALQAARIVTSPEGDALRQQLSTVVNTLREELKTHRLTCMGIPSAIVPVWVGDERVLRVMYRSLLEHKVHANAVEFPAVASGSARFRLQVMASHTSEHARIAAHALGQAWKTAIETLEAEGNEPQVTPTLLRHVG